MVLLLAALVALAATTAESRISYRNHKVLEVSLQSDEHMQLISRLQQEGVDVWTAVAGRHAHLRVSPSTLDFVNETLVDAGLSPRVLIPDVQKVIDMEAESIQVAEARRGRASWVGKSFVRYNEIEAWITALPSTCGNRCAIKVIGKSYENRNIYVIRISDDLTQSGSRKVLFFESNIHAREWLSHASMAYIVQTMLDKYGTDAKITQAMKQYEWHFVVMSNPDGYEYTWTNDRVWRKTRTPYSKVCFGADPNRNFDDHHCGEGTSTNACSDIYCGPTPFSEKETQVLRDYSTSIASRLLSFQSVHAYSQLVLLPFAYTSKAYPPDFSELTRVANLMTNAIFETSKKRYTAGNVADLLYPAAGSSMDWARNKLNTKYPIAWEVRPSQNAPNGFVVAPTEIIPTGNELLQAFLVMSQSI